MKTKAKSLALLLAVLLAPGVVGAQSVGTEAGTTAGAVVLPSAGSFDGKTVSVDGRLDKVKMHIGDVVTYTITARHPDGLEAGTAVAGRILTASGFEIRDFMAPETKVVDDEVVDTRSFTFSTFTTGTYGIPPIPVDFRHKDGRTVTLATLPLTVDVVPVPRRPGEPDDLRDIKGPLSLPVAPLWPWVAGVVLVLAVLGLVLRRLRRRNRDDEVVVTPLDAYEDARQRLQDLRRRRDEGELDVKTYHYGFAEILRIYLERRFSVTSLSETTAELLEGLSSGAFPPAELDVIRGLLEESDLVKFARYQPTPDEVRQHDGALDEFLERTRPVPEPVVADDEEVVVDEDDDDGAKEAAA